MVARYIEFVLRHRAAIVAFCAAMTLLLGWSMTGGVLSSSFLKLFFGESDAYDEHVELVTRFGDSNLMVVAFDDPTILTPEGIVRIKRIASKIEALEIVARVETVASADRIKGSAEELIIEPFGPLLEVGSEKSAQLRQEILDHPLIQETLLSADGQSAALMVEFAVGPEKPIEELPAVLDSIVAPFLKEGFRREDLHLAGMVSESVEATSQARFNLQRLFPATVLILVLVVYLLFMQVWPVLITGGIALLSIIWVFGIAILYNPNVNIMMATVPAVMMVVAFSDVIHLCSAYMLALRAGSSKREAIVTSGSEVGVACLYTSITTLFGFAALVLVPTPLFRQLGIVLGLGVAIALVLAVTLVPIFFSVMPTPTTTMTGRSSWIHGWIDRFNMGCMRLSVAHPVWVVGSFVAIALICAVGMSRMKVETDIPARLDEGNHIRVAQRFIADRFAGTNFVDLYIFAEGESDLLEPADFHRLAAYQSAVEKIPGVDRVLSLIDVVEMLHRELAVGSKHSTSDLPDTRALLSQYLLLFEMSGGDGLERLIDEERRTMRMTLRLAGTGLVGTADIGNRATELADSILGPGLRVKPSGLTFLFGEWIDFIIAGQQRGLIFALVTIALMMMLTVRGVWAGLISMIPNVLPLAVLGGYLGLAWDSIDSDTILVAMIAIGMAVDDTIHFLTRLRIETARTESTAEALQRTFAFTGRAIVLTTVILCAGFSPFASSDYFSTRILGTLLPLALAAALFADLLLLPALVELRILRFNNRAEDRGAGVDAATA